MESAAIELATKEANPKTLEQRKIQLMVCIAQLDDVDILDRLENIVFSPDGLELQEEISQEERAFIEERIADLEANPDETTSVDEFIAELRRERQ